MTLLTEAEAKERPCPFFRYILNEADVLQNEASAIYVHAPCAASACIAWRFWGGRYAGYEKPTRGGCGIAGKPEE